MPKTQQEGREMIKRLINCYENYRKYLEESREVATAHVISSYDDFHEWCNETGNFKKRKP